MYGPTLQVAAHFNHRLRGVASDRDALFASALARAAGVPCIVGEPAAPLVDDASNLEAGARAARYAFLHQVADAAGASAIGLRATPVSIAAWATRGGTYQIRRGSNGAGMM